MTFTIHIAEPNWTGIVDVCCCHENISSRDREEKWILHYL